jgi:epoxyqueuosine reductase
MTSKLVRQLEEHGYKARIASIQHLHELQEGVEGYYKQGLIDAELYREYLTSFTFSVPNSFPDARSLIVVAVPQPQFRVTFTWNGKPIPVIVPPTYLYSKRTNKQVEDVLAEILAREGYRVTQARLPQKLLAVHSGLGAYGKNNVCYVEGMGSFHRPVAFYSDFPCQEDHWQEVRMMEACQRCSACLRKCPTGAITSERFLLHAERCITFRNEKPGDVPFPEWIHPSWHNCLVGCLDCQTICPQNRDVLQWIDEGAEFSQEETALFLEGVSLDQLPAATVKKLQHFDMVEYLDLFPRNLHVFFERDLPQVGP